MKNSKITTGAILATKHTKHTKNRDGWFVMTKKQPVPCATFVYFVYFVCFVAKMQPFVVLLFL